MLRVHRSRTADPDAPDSTGSSWHQRWRTWGKQTFGSLRHTPGRAGVTGAKLLWLLLFAAAGVALLAGTRAVMRARSSAAREPRYLVAATYLNMNNQRQTLLRSLLTAQQLGFTLVLPHWQLDCERGRGRGKARMYGHRYTHIHARIYVRT